LETNFCATGYTEWKRQKGNNDVVRNIEQRLKG